MRYVENLLMGAFVNIRGDKLGRAGVRYAAAILVAVETMVLHLVRMERVH